MSSVTNVTPVGPGSVPPPISHRWTRVRGRRGPSSIQWPGLSGVPSTLASGIDSIGPMYATPSPRTSRYQRIAFLRSDTTIATVSTPTTVIGLFPRTRRPRHERVPDLHPRGTDVRDAHFDTPRPYIFVYHSMTSASLIRSTCSPTS